MMTEPKQDGPTPDADITPGAAVSQEKITITVPLSDRSPEAGTDRQSNHDAAEKLKL